LKEPHQDGTDRISGVEKSPLSASAVGSGIAILLLVGLLLRLFLAYVLLPGSGFTSDIGTFTAWAVQLAQSGPGSFYATAGFADYPPGYMYLLWIVGELGNILAPLAHNDPTAATAALVKIPPILCDIAIGYVLYRIVLSWRAGRPDARRLALIAAAIYVFNPVTWYDSAIWGQTDSVGSLVLLLSVWALIRGNSEGAAVLATVAALIKPQFGVVALPLVGIVLLRRHLFRPEDQPHNKVLVPQRIRGWFEYERGAWRLVSSAVASLIVLLIIITPFSLGPFDFLQQMAKTAGGYPWLSVNAYNPWAMIGSDGNQPLAFGGGWSPDTVPLLGPIPGFAIGTLLLAVGFALGLARVAWRDNRRTILVVGLVLALGFFMLPTRVHERYMFPIFVFLPLLAIVNRRWAAATIILSIAAFINMHGILTTPLYATANLENLPLGELFREPVAIVSAVVLNVIGFAFICWALRPSAASDPDEYDLGSWVETPGDSDEDDGAEGEAEDGPVEPNEPSAPWYAPLSALVPAFSIRRDRSALLNGEGGGKLGRRDLALFVLIFLAALFLRTYRLEVPYGMHFDEVYHARTAMEFLQDWRYDMPHSIYEYTHPHVAKYGMALGIELLGNHRVTSTVDLGAPTTDATIEQRWSPTDQPDEHLGDRLYVATGSNVDVYDMEQPGPRKIASIEGPFVAVAVDPATHTLYAGQADGTIAQLPTSGFDELRSSPGADVTNLQPAPFGTMPGLDGPLVRLAVVGEQLVGLSSGGTLVSIDWQTGAETGRTTLPGTADLISVPAHGLVMVDPAKVTDRAALSAELATLLDDDAARIEQVIASAKGPVPIAGYVGDKKQDVQAKIDDGSLPGVTIVSDGTAVAVADPHGVTFFDSTTLAQLADIATTDPATGLALAERGPDQPTIYAATGSSLSQIHIPSVGSGVSLGASVPMPNQVEKVYWNEATTNVHALGTTQDGSSPTVYVVEPRGNSVFADAPLPFEPQIAVMDAQHDYPAEDRNDLLAFSPTGELATVDTGNNQFAYRFPGVLLGALTAALIFLLARFLFRRRSIAVIAAILVLTDGMFFANSRIAMNDTYVNFFIVAAFTLFVPLWLGRWRKPWITTSVLISVGVLLGLALASKWVGAYAIGAVGLLILIRSALGRWIALAAMIGMTGLLGYVAITPNPTVANPQINYLFLAIMIVLTLVLAIGITVRPMRMTRDEFRFAVAVPLLLGAIATIYGTYRIIAGPPAAPNALLPPTRILAIGLVGIVVGMAVAGLGWYLGRHGRGPLATAATIDPDAPIASPPPERGWLRPGSGFLGLPWVLALVLMSVVPLVVYVISYIPWINLGNQWFAGYPAGHTGQTFIALQQSMYDYHNFLRATHPASSPWWAWPLDLKPVWFEQSDYAGGTTAVIYDTGNIVSFWLSIPAVIWVSWKAWTRRSLALGFLVILVLCMWLPWARIDRATFQYHFFTTLPFSFMALAYFLAELWHGPSPRTWRLAKLSAAVAIIGAPLLWLFRLPLCGIANTEQVNKGTEVCGSLSRDFQLTSFQLIGVVLALGGLIAAGILVYLSLRESSGTGGRPRPLLAPIAFSVALFGSVLVIVGAALPGTAVFQAHVTAEMPAFIALLLLCVPAYFVLQGRDPKRYVVGVLVAATVWFVAFYPNIASLPVPTPLSQIHLGLLPTWNWGFQFGVNLDEPNRNPIEWISVAILTLAVTALCIAAIYAVRNWHSIRGEERDPIPPADESFVEPTDAPEPGGEADGADGADSSVVVDGADLAHGDEVSGSGEPAEAT
jgi:Gpi18-like mannosyltransferase